MQCAFARRRKSRSAIGERPAAASHPGEKRGASSCRVTITTAVGGGPLRGTSYNFLKRSPPPSTRPSKIALFVCARCKGHFGYFVQFFFGKGPAPRGKRGAHPIIYFFREIIFLRKIIVQSVHCTRDARECAERSLGLLLRRRGGLIGLENCTKPFALGARTQAAGSGLFFSAVGRCHLPC